MFLKCSSWCVLGPPDTPSNISYTPDVNSVSFKLKPGFYNGANQTFYVEYSADRNATVWNNDTFVEAGFKKAPDYFKAATVHGLQAETTYYFRVKGVNMYGESEPTEILAVKTKEGKRNEPPHDKTNKMSVRPAKTQISPV